MGVHNMSSGDENDNDQPKAGRVLVNPETMTPNPAVPDTVWQKFESLPSQARPQRGARPPRRLTALAHELATDNLLPNAGKKAHAELHKVLDAAQAGRVVLEDYRPLSESLGILSRTEGLDEPVRRGVRGVPGAGNVKAAKQCLRNVHVGAACL